MAIQDLKPWASTKVVDGVTEKEQRRNISDNEWMDGWLRQQSVSYQQLNQLLFLLSSYSSPNPFTIQYIPDVIGISDIMLECNGSVFLIEDAPELYSLFGGTMPDYTSSTPSGMKSVMRKQ